MPELPEVETVRKALKNKVLNKKIKDIKIIYPKVFAIPSISEVEEKIKNQTIQDMKRYGKWLIFVLDDYYLLSHLRMEGKYLYRNINDIYGKHELVSFILDDMELRYQDVRKFGRFYLLKKDELYSDKSPLIKLGKDPWDNTLTIDYLKEKYKNKKLEIKSCLLDQSIIVGIGNIYADEILFLSKVNPYKKCCDLNDLELKNIIDNTRIVLKKAIEEGGTTIRSYTSEEGVGGKFQNNLYVHKRENEECKICKNKIVREKIHGRSTYFCKACQK